MIRSANEGWLPVNGLPVGLLSWFAADGPVVMLVSWLAIIDGRPPELRAGCSGRAPGRQVLPADIDFTVNIPADPSPPALQRLIARAGSGGPVTLAAAETLAPARSVQAPLLADCALQVECAHGRVAADHWGGELSGEIVLLHRGGLLVHPAIHPEFCALQPLLTRVPA